MTYPSAEKVSEKCDWIAFTIPFYKDLIWPDFIDQNWKEISKIKGYNKGQENRQGVQLFWNTERPGQGKHIILHGSTLINLQGNTDAILNWIQKGEYHVSRIDLCIDIMDSNLNPRNATYHLEKGQFKSHARKAPRWDDPLNPKGFTQYVGKKSSETFVRIYDKASEMGTDFRWIRVEIVYTGDRGKAALQAYLRDKTVMGMVKGFVDFPKWKKWNCIMQHSPTKLHVPPKQTKTRIWLLSTVSKSLAREMALEDDQDFYIQFRQKVQEEYLAIVESKDRIVDF